VVAPQNDFIAAGAALNKARVQLDLARIAEKRSHDLYEGKAGALKDWQQAQDKLTAAENDLRAAESALDAADHRLRIIGKTQAEIAGLHGKGDINRMIAIQSPIDGTVVARRIGPGQFVRSDTGEALYTLADVSTMWLKAQVPETDIPLVRLGQDLEVRVAALPGRVYKARVTAIATASDMATHRVIVRSEIPNPDGSLKAEMFALIKITTGDGETTPAVPVEAVIREPDAAVVWLEREPMLFERRKVTLGAEQDGRLQIRDGLSAGDQVVGRGAIFVDNEWRQ
jgi:cobalt-zinc-cadmium efflux system membrane fusion protein